MARSATPSERALGLVAAAGVLLVAAFTYCVAPAAAAESAPPASGLTLTASTPAERYDLGQPVPLTLSVTNNTGTPCSLATAPNGALHVTEVVRDGVALEPSLGSAFFTDGLEPELRRSLRATAPGETVSVTADARRYGAGGDPSLLSVDALPGGHGVAGLWPVGAAGRYVVSATYAVPAISMPGGEVCPGSSDVATVAFTVGDEGTGSPVRRSLLGALLALMLGAAAWLGLRRRRPGMATGLALVLVTGLFAGSATRAEAEVVVDGQGQAGFQAAYDACMAASTAPGGDPEGILKDLNNPKTPRVTIIPSPNDGSDTFETPKSPAGAGSSTIVWNPDSTVVYEDGVARNGCAALYHELGHAREIQKGKADKGMCGDTGIPTEEVRATFAENRYRKAHGLPPRTGYKGNELPKSLDECKKKPSKPSKAPKKLCEGLPGDACGATNGDPHLTTFDQYRYSAQAVGELVLAESDSGDLALQARQAPLGTTRTVAVNTAVAMRIGTSRVGFYLDRGALTVRVDGRVTPFARGEHVLPSGARLLRQESGVLAADGYLLTWPDGSGVQLDPIGAFGIRMYARLAPVRKGQVRGLLGNFDGDDGNELRTRDGAPVPQPPDFEQLYRTLVESWRVAPGESLFDYDGQDPAALTDRSFPDRMVTAADLDPAARERARAICAAAGVTDPGLLEDCILDVAVSGQAVFAVSAGDAQQSLPDTPQFRPGAGPTFTFDDDATTRALTTDEATIDVSRAGAVGRVTFPGAAGQVLFVDLPSSSLPNECGLVTLLAPGGEAMQSSCVINGTGYLDRTPLAATGTYTLVIDPRDDATGRTRLRKLLVADSEVSARVGGAAASLEVSRSGGVATATFDGTAGQKVFGLLRAPDLPSECGLTTLRAPDGAVLQTGCIINGVGYLDAITLPVTGRYSVVLDPAGPRTGSAQLTLTSATDSSRPIAVDGPAVTARVEQPGSVSRLTFAGMAGQRVAVDLDEGTLESECGLVTLRGPEGAVLETGCVINGTGSVEATILPATGRYELVLDPAEDGIGAVRVRAHG